jgi:hypothetical protein
MGHKKVCFTCRKAFSIYKIEDRPVNLKCQQCGNDTTILYYTFKPPKIDDLKQWDLAKFYVDNGFIFQHVYDANGHAVVYPRTMEEAKVFVEQYRRKAKASEENS